MSGNEVDQCDSLAAGDTKGNFGPETDQGTFQREPLSSRLRESLLYMAEQAKRPHQAVEHDENGDSHLAAFLITTCNNAVNGLQESQIPIEDQDRISDALQDIAHLAPDLIETIEAIAGTPKRQAAFNSIWLLMEAVQIIGGLGFINKGSDAYYKTKRAAENGRRTAASRKAQAKAWQDLVLPTIKSGVVRKSINTHQKLYNYVLRERPELQAMLPAERSFSRYVRQLEDAGLVTNIKRRAQKVAT